MKELLEKIRFYIHILLDKDTPRRAKVMLIFAIAYLFLPFDIIPDFSLIVGQFDDLVVVPLLFYIATRMVPDAVRNKYKNPKASSR